MSQETPPLQKRTSVVIHPKLPQIPQVAVTRSSTHSHSPFQAHARRTSSTQESTMNSQLKPPTTPLGMSEPDSYPFPYATRSATNDVSLYRTTTSYSQWGEEEEEEDTTDQAPAQTPSRLVDQVDRARPAVDYQDMLWTQIDILDDVRRMAEQSTEDGSFFSKEHTRALDELKRTQGELLRQLKGVERVLDSVDDHKVIWDSSDMESVRERLYNREYFDGVKKGLESVREKLDEVGESMRKVDERRE